MKNGYMHDYKLLWIKLSDKYHILDVEML
jgi:hypothetical protein